MRGKWSECFLGIAGAIGLGNLKSWCGSLHQPWSCLETIIDIRADRLYKEDQIPFFFGQNTDKEVVEGIGHAGILAFDFHIVVVITPLVTRELVSAMTRPRLALLSMSLEV